MLLDVGPCPFLIGKANADFDVDLEKEARHLYGQNEISNEKELEVRQ